MTGGIVLSYTIKLKFLILSCFQIFKVRMANPISYLFNVYFCRRGNPRSVQNRVFRTLLGTSKGFLSAFISVTGVRFEGFPVFDFRTYLLFSARHAQRKKSFCLTTRKRAKITIKILYKSL